MKTKAPRFWQKENSLRAGLLMPLSYLYQAGHALNQSFIQPYKSKLPVICIGNLTSGGSGKTPVTLSLAKLLLHHQICQKPCILSRGYGGTKDLHIVTATDSYSDVGDEPLILAGSCPVIIARNRANGAKLAEEKGFDLVLMDDGFQNNQLYKDISLIVVDGSLGFGNRKVLPAGPLRESLEDGFKRTSALIIINHDTYGLSKYIPSSLPKFFAHAVSSFKPLPNQDYIGFCGIGYPEKFKKTLRDQGVSVLNFIDYPDHHPYSPKDAEFLIQQAEAFKARLITTEKDYVKLTNYPKLMDYIDTLPLKLSWEDEDAFLKFLKKELPA